MAYNPPAMTVAQMDALLAFLPVFTPSDYEPWGPSQLYDFFNALPYNGTVRAFRDTYMQVCKDIHPYHRLPEDGPEVTESAEIFSQFGTIEAMKTASANQIRRLLMLCTRGEHFGFSSTGDLLAAGVITAALQRLQELRAELISQEGDTSINMNDADLDNFFRLTTSHTDALRLLDTQRYDAHRDYTKISPEAPFIYWVGRVTWNGPHEPGIYYTPFRSWKKQPTPAMIARARQAALRNRKYFRICTRCHRITNDGHMHDSNICQGCAERYLGVVY